MSKNNKDQHIETKVPQFMVDLFKPQPKKQTERRAWNIGIDSIWIPFFSASNIVGKTNIDKSALGCPIRLRYNQDGSVRFSKNGRIVTSVAKELSEAISGVRSNLVAGMVTFTETVKSENTEAYNAERTACLKAGAPILKADSDNLLTALKKRSESAVTEAENIVNEHKEKTPETNGELVTA